MNTVLELAREVGKLTLLVCVAALATQAAVDPARVVYVRAHMRAKKYWGATPRKAQNRADALWMHL